MVRRKFKKKKSTFIIFLWFSILLLLFCFLSFKATQSFSNFQEGLKILKEKIKEKEDLEAKLATLQKTLSQIQSPEGFIIFLKEKFGLVQEGENLVYVIWPEKSENSTQKKENFLKKIMNSIQKVLDKVLWFQKMKN